MKRFNNIFVIIIAAVAGFAAGFCFSCQLYSSSTSTKVPDERQPEYGEGTYRLGSRNRDEREKLLAAILSQKKEREERVLAVLRNKALHIKEPHTVALAIDLAGEYRIAKAVPYLLDLLTFAPSHSETKQTEYKISVNSGTVSRPSLLALIKIGEPSVTLGIQLLKKPDLGSKYETVPLFITTLLKCVHGDQGIETLKNGLKEVQNPTVRKRFISCIDHYDQTYLPEDVTRASDRLFKTTN